MNKRTRLFVSTIVWLLIIIARSLLMSAGKNATTCWGDPHSYYAIWLTDFFIIAVFYLNYYLLAPAMIGKRHYATYGWTVLILMSVSVLLPLCMYFARGWSLPDTPDGNTPIYFSAPVQVIAVMAVGSAIRAVREWVRLEADCTVLSRKLAEALKATQSVGSPAKAAQKDAAPLHPATNNEKLGE